MATRITYEILELAHAGMEADEIANILDVGIEIVYIALSDELEKLVDKRSLDCLSMYKEGKTLAEIGDKYGGLTRERIRQIIKRQAGYELGFYSVHSQTEHKNEIQSYVRSMVGDSRSERKDAETTEKINLAKQRGIEPEYFDSIKNYCEATGISIDALRTYQRPTYDMIRKAELRKKQRWSRDYDVCRMCHTTDYKHSRQGYCEKCYPKSIEFKETVKASYIKNYEKRQRHNKEYASRPEVKARIAEKNSENYFGGNWRKTLERDGWKCRGCGMKYNEAFTAGGMHKVRVWRLNKDSSDNRPENLMALCQRCYRDRINRLSVGR